MKKSFLIIAMAAFLATVATIYAGTGYFMKCQAKPEKDPKTEKPVKKPCGYGSRVSFGGGMFSQQATGYCRVCKKFVYLHWTRKNIPEQLKDQIKHKARPKPLGEVWDSQTGRVMTVYACPTCKGPFLEIKKVEDLKCCPACNKPHFAIDKSKPMIAYD